MSQSIEIQSKDIKLVPIDQIKANPANRNSHSAEQIDRLAKIIQYQGFRNPLIVSNRTGLVVAGHGRLMAAQKLGLTELPVMYQDFKDGDAEYAAMVSDNSIASWSELDLAGINSDLGDLGPDFDIDMLGLKDFEIEPADKETDLDADDAPQPPKVARTKRGDIYKLGDHVLMCGDATDTVDVNILCGSEKMSAVVTDPPYNVGKDYAGEDLNSDEFLKLHQSWMERASFVSADDAAFYIYFGVKWLWPMADVVRSFLKNPRLLVWYRPDGHGAGGGDFFYNYDPIFYGSKSGKFHTRKYDGDFNRDVWIVNKAKESEGGYFHPTAKPIKVVEAAILTSTNAQDSVLDLFGGSGSTLIGCERTNRRCFTMELDPTYCDAIISRWCKFTGNAKVNLGTETIDWVTE